MAITRNRNFRIIRGGMRGLAGSSPITDAQANVVHAFINKNGSQFGNIALNTIISAAAFDYPRSPSWPIGVPGMPASVASFLNKYGTQMINLPMWSSNIVGGLYGLNLAFITGTSSSYVAFLSYFGVNQGPDTDLTGVILLDKNGNAVDSYPSKADWDQYDALFRNGGVYPLQNDPSAKVQIVNAYQWGAKPSPNLQWYVPQPSQISFDPRFGLYAPLSASQNIPAPDTGVIQGFLSFAVQFAGYAAALYGVGTAIQALTDYATAAAEAAAPAPVPSAETEAAVHDTLVQETQTLNAQAAQTASQSSSIVDQATQSIAQKAAQAATAPPTYQASPSPEVPSASTSTIPKVGADNPTTLSSEFEQASTSYEAAPIASTPAEIAASSGAGGGIVGTAATAAAGAIKALTASGSSAQPTVSQARGATGVNYLPGIAVGSQPRPVSTVISQGVSNTPWWYWLVLIGGGILLVKTLDKRGET